MVLSNIFYNYFDFPNQIPTWYFPNTLSVSELMHEREKGLIKNYMTLRGGGVGVRGRDDPDIVCTYE
jgi:hypothetical protein